jgi:hypothetical protein
VRLVRLALEVATSTAGHRAWGVRRAGFGCDSDARE